jgi:hypothetical protein
MWFSFCAFCETFASFASGLRLSVPYFGVNPLALMMPAQVCV